MTTAYADRLREAQARLDEATRVRADAMEARDVALAEFLDHGSYTQAEKITKVSRKGIYNAAMRVRRERQVRGAAAADT